LVASSSGKIQSATFTSVSPATSTTPSKFVVNVVAIEGQSITTATIKAELALILGIPAAELTIVCSSGCSGRRRQASGTFTYEVTVVESNDETSSAPSHFIEVFTVTVLAGFILAWF